MKNLDWFRDMIKDERYDHDFFNLQIQRISNPAARQIFAEIRDEDMIHIIRLQERVAALESPPKPVTLRG